MNTSIISTRIDVKTLKKLEKLSKSTKRSKSYLTAEAIQLYVDDQSWQIEAINEGVKQADSGNFATEKEVKKIFKKWGVNGD
jgi:RHH-type rel operon transcriptional repressor/antitoxin RelB